MNLGQQLLHDLWAGLLDRPWLLALLLFVVVYRAVGFVRAVIHAGHPKDGIRRFSRADKTEILARAGNRCERHSVLYGRCPRTDALEADHVHPHSRGGWTAVSNGQALCRRHNKGKAARVPWGWELRRLARRRAAYFPPGVPTEVTRHRPRSVARH
ncbi:HNH endonuclease [Geodermatophilus sp. SYSU D00684]